ncbi:MAG: gamma-glutamylcyclotransferase [Desulfurobacteriaceae bacterium]
MEEKKYLLFVYGTLKKGFWNHHFLQNEKFVGKAETKEKYAMYVTRIPFVVKNEKVSTIKGKVYEVSKETLKEIDRLEGHPEWYKRELVPVVVSVNGKKKEVKAYVYFSLDPRGVIKEDGIF